MNVVYGEFGQGEAATDQGQLRRSNHSEQTCASLGLKESFVSSRIVRTHYAIGFRVLSLRRASRDRVVNPGISVYSNRVTFLCSLLKDIYRAEIKMPIYYQAPVSSRPWLWCMKTGEHSR
jgi:hypothetical protein